MGQPLSLHFSSCKHRKPLAFEHVRALTQNSRDRGLCPLRPSRIVHASGRPSQLPRRRHGKLLTNDLATRSVRTWSLTVYFPCSCSVSTSSLPSPSGPYPAPLSCEYIPDPCIPIPRLTRMRNTRSSHTLLAFATSPCRLTFTSPFISRILYYHHGVLMSDIVSKVGITALYLCISGVSIEILSGLFSHWSKIRC